MGNVQLLFMEINGCCCFCISIIGLLAEEAKFKQAAIKSSGELVSLIQQIRNEARFAINDLLKVGLWLVVFKECMD
jgi:hypothetical protein